MRAILVTGGAGFIGSHLVRRLVHQHPNRLVVNLDALTYAGHLGNLRDVEAAPNYRFEKADITDAEAVSRVFETYAVEAVFHLAAESHVDRSILDPLQFVRTNVLGTAVLLNQARHSWRDRSDVRFVHVSTDEVFGSLGPQGFFTEATPYDPHSPYSASKAGSDHLARAYCDTFGLPVLVTNCSNNYGPNQFPEKLIPLMISRLVAQEPLPVYGKGDNVRDWLWVEDHCAALQLVWERGTPGQTYAIGGLNEWKNLDLVHLLCRMVDERLNRPAGTGEALIRFVTDRPGHDQRYAIDPSKIGRELGWKPSLTFEEGLARTVDWYLAHPEWVEEVRSGEYLRYHDQQYRQRLA